MFCISQNKTKYAHKDMQAQSLTHARTHTSVAQESSGFEYAYTQFFTHLKIGKNSTEFKNQALICKVSAWLSRIGLILCEWRPVEISVPKGLYYNRGETRRALWTGICLLFTQIFTIFEVVLTEEFLVITKNALGRDFLFVLFTINEIY